MIYNGWLDVLNTIFLNDENIISFIGLAIIILLGYFLILRKQIASIYDPFFYSILCSAFAAAIPIEMYSKSLMQKDIYIISFLTTEFAYILGLLVFKKRKTKKFIEFTNDYKMLGFMYYFFSVIFIILKLVDFTFIGSPLSTDGSRLDFYREGHSAVFSIIATNISYPIMFFSIYRWFNGMSVCEKAYDLFVWILIFMAAVSGGAKGAGLSFVWIFYFLYEKFCKDKGSKKKMNHMMNLFFLLSVIVALYILYLQFDTAFLFALLHRCVSYGDIFGYFYGDDFSGSLVLRQNIFMEITKDALAFLRIIPYGQELDSIGLQIWQYLNQSLVTMAPNGRHNIIGYLYLGVYGSMVYSFLLGLLSSYIRNILFFYKSNNIYIYICTTQLYLIACSIPADMAFVVSLVVQFFLINGALGGIVYSLYKYLLVRNV